MLLTIAGFDPSSGAGITADLQVFAAHGMYGTSCATALTVQSTQGVRAVHSVTPWMQATLDELDADLPPAGVKLGMLCDRGGVDAAVQYLSHVRKREATRTPVVLDPVLVSSSGALLLSEDALECLRERLLPLVDWITPNRGELAVLASRSAGTEDALRALGKQYPQLHIIATGGEDVPPLDTLRLPDGTIHTYTGEHIATTSTHGTGCAFSAALVAHLVQGNDAGDAVAAAKGYVREALRNAPGLGHGRGPMDLLWPLRSQQGGGPDQAGRKPRLLVG